MFSMNFMSYVIHNNTSCRVIRQKIPPFSCAHCLLPCVFFLLVFIEAPMQTQESGKLLLYSLIHIVGLKVILVLFLWRLERMFRYVDGYLVKLRLGYEHYKCSKCIVTLRSKLHHHTLSGYPDLVNQENRPFISSGN